MLTVHPPVAAQDVAPVLDQVIVEDCPDVIEMGAALMATLGCCKAVT